MAWASSPIPRLLTGDGHLAPLRAIPRLIELLPRRCRRHRSARPAPVAVVSCVSTSRWMGFGSAEPASRTPVSKSVHVAGPVENRSPAIGTIGRSAPTASSPTRRIWRPASDCGRRRPVSRRTPHGPLCPTCHALPVLTCSICGDTTPCGISRTTGRPWCPACQRRSATCSSLRPATLPIAPAPWPVPLCAGCRTPAAWLRLSHLQRPRPPPTRASAAAA